MSKEKIGVDYSRILKHPLPPKIQHGLWNRVRVRVPQVLRLLVLAGFLVVVLVGLLAATAVVLIELNGWWPEGWS